MISYLRRNYIIVALLIISAFVLISLVGLFVFLSAADRTVIVGKQLTYEYKDSVRHYRMYKPSGDIRKILIGLHGFGDTSRRFAYYTGLHNLTDEYTMVVYPEASVPLNSGIKKGWNAGFCCGSGYIGDVDDAGFLAALIADIKAEHEKESAKIFVTGFSNGAFMSQKMATDYPDLIDGIAISSGSIGTTKKSLDPKVAVPVLLMHGEKDLIVPFTGGEGASDPDFEWRSFEDTRQAWESINEGQVSTEVITYPNNGHKWDGWRLFNFWHKAPNASHEVIQFINSI